MGSRMKSKNNKRDPAELLKIFKRLCPTKGSGIESVTILRRGSNGLEALITFTEESERRIDKMLKILAALTEEVERRVGETSKEK